MQQGLIQNALPADIILPGSPYVRVFRDIGGGYFAKLPNGTIEPFSGVPFTLDIGDAIGLSTIGSVLFVGAANDLQQDNTNFFWENISKTLSIGTNTPDASSILQLDSTSRGILIPRMTTVQRNAIVAPATGLEIYNTTTGLFNYWDGVSWVALTTGAPFTLDIGDLIGLSTIGSVLFVGAGNLLAEDNTQFFWDNVSNKLGVGTNTPTSTLQVLNTGGLASHFRAGSTAVPLIMDISARNVGIGIAGSSAAGLRINYSGLATTLGLRIDVSGASTGLLIEKISGGATMVGLLSRVNVAVGTNGNQLDVVNTVGVVVQRGLMISGGQTGAGVADQSGVALLFALKTGLAVDTDYTRLDTGRIATRFITNETQSAMTFDVRIAGVLTEAMRIDELGNIGIGTTSPGGANLMIEKSIFTSIMLSAYGVANLPFYNGRGFGGTPGAPTATTIGNILVGMSGAGHNGVAFTAYRGLYDIIAAETWTAIANGVHHVWQTTPIGSIVAAESMRLDSLGRLGIGIAAPTAFLHLKAGIATAGRAPLKLVAGTNLTTPENGAIEFDGTNIFITVGGVRKTFTIV